MANKRSKEVVVGAEGVYVRSSGGKLFKITISDTGVTSSQEVK